MALEASDVEKIAHLARLGIKAHDIPGYTRNLTDIRPGPQPASLFDVPAGFSEVTAGQGNTR